MPERFSLTVVHQDKKHAFPVCPQAPLRDVFHDPDDPIVVDTSSWMKWDGGGGIKSYILDNGEFMKALIVEDKAYIRKGLINLLETVETKVEIIGECATVKEAVVVRLAEAAEEFCTACGAMTLAAT